MQSESVAIGGIADVAGAPQTYAIDPSRKRNVHRSSEMMFICVQSREQSSFLPLSRSRVWLTLVTLQADGSCDWPCGGDHSAHGQSRP